MVNSEEFIGRLETVLRYYDLSASAFADKIKVQRSSISHILSARNKPSLEFVLKIIHTFPEVNLYWLLKGKGSFPSSKSPRTKIAPPTPIPVQIPVQENQKIKVEPTKEKVGIEKIIILYTDGSFKSYTE